MSLKILLSLFLFLSADLANAKLRIQSFSPGQNFPEIRQVKGPHLAITDDEVKPNNFLFITIGGTNSAPSEYGEMHRIAAGQGYAVLSVDYPDEVISTVCRERPLELDCYDNYRAEIVLGQQLSGIVQVDEKNSLLFRIRDLFSMLQKSEPALWNKFLNAQGALDWSRVVLAGHSQGSGHAVYLSKMFAVKAVIMTGGPQDWLEKTGPSHWILQPGVTKSSSYFALLHKDDFFGSDSQILLARLLLGDAKAPLTRIQDQVSPDETSHILLSEFKTQDPHNALLKPLYTQVWEQLLIRASR